LDVVLVQDSARIVFPAFDPPDAIEIEQSEVLVRPCHKVLRADPEPAFDA